MREEKLRIKSLSSTVQPQSRGAAGSREPAACGSGPAQQRAQTERSVGRSPSDGVKARQARFQKELHKQVLQAATAGIFERKRQAREEVESVLAAERSRGREVRFTEQLRRMRGVMKARLCDIATARAEKSRQLSKKVEVGKRLEQENRQQAKKVRAAQRLVNYSLDIENMIKSNIELATDLEAHYAEKNAPRAGQAGPADPTDKVEEGFSLLLRAEEPSLRENSAHSLGPKKSASSTRAGPELSYDVHRLRRSRELQPGLEDGEVCTPRHGDSGLPQELSHRAGSIGELLRTASPGDPGPPSTDRREAERSARRGFLPRLAKQPRSLLRKGC